MAATGLPQDDEGSRRPGAANNDDSNHDYERQDLKPYTFNGRIVIGIALILAAAAGSTILAMTVSQSPQASIPTSAMSSTINAATDSNVPNAMAQGQNGAEPDREIILVANDFGWNGSENGPTIRLTKGDVVRLTITNAGQMAHNFGIAKMSDTAMTLLEEIDNMTLPERVQHVPYNDMAAMPCPGCEKKLHQAHIEFFIKPGNQHTVTFTAEEAGEFKYFCMVRGHIWLGMNGDIVVEEPGEFIVEQPAAGANGGA